MHRLLYPMITLLGLASAAPAHFIWLLPDSGKSGENPTVRLVFSDQLAPDDADLLKKIKHTNVFVRGADGKTVPVKHTPGTMALDVALTGTGSRIVAATCRYGILQRGDSDPFQLTYHAKTVIGEKAPVPPALARPVQELALDIVVVAKDRLVGQVLWQGKPLADAEVVLLVPGQEKNAVLKTDKNGEFPLAEARARGLYGIRAKYIEKRAGQEGGKKYTEARHYATLVLATPSGFNKAPIKGSKTFVPEEGYSFVAKEGELKENPEATRLLAEARAARANWVNFPGFSAVVEVNTNGKLAQGHVEVDAMGKVKLTGFSDREIEGWARRQLASIVSHRMDGSANQKTPCAFADEDVHHPLGRAIKVLNDEFHSSYRIRDRQVIVVNRQMPGERFSITVLENKRTPEKKFLSSIYVVNSWDLKTNALKSSQTFHQTWKRIGKLDLPAGVLIISAGGEGKTEARQITLRDHKVN